MGLFEAAGRGADRALSGTWEGLKKLDPVARGALVGAAAGAAHRVAKRKTDPVTGEKEPAGPAVADGAVKGLGLGAGAVLTARGLGELWKKAGVGAAFRSEMAKLAERRRA